jgi:hypothetical protein
MDDGTICAIVDVRRGPREIPMLIVYVLDFALS